MKKTMKTMMTPLLALALCLTLILPFFATACGTALSYTGETLMAGKVGEEYSAYVGTATGADTVTYALKEGSALPAGLSIDADGFITGIPSAKTDGAQFTVVAASGESTAEATFTIAIGEGTVTYEGGSLRVASGVPFTRSVATATGASGITYAFAEGSEIAAGISLDATGVLTGTASPEGGALEAEYSLAITASAPDCASATAVFTLNVGAPWLDYEPVALQTATVGSYFTGLVNSAADGTDLGDDVNVTYTLTAGSKLPAGLEMDNDGLIYGTPEEDGTFAFSVTASARSYLSATAEFTLKVNRALDVEASEGTIRFTSESGVTVERNTDFAALGAVSARASNRLPVTLEVTGGELPDGLTFYPNGTIIGNTKDTGEFVITITATAEGCEPVSTEFTITVLVTLLYSGESFVGDPANDLYVGEDCEVSLATAEFPSGTNPGDAKITYTVSSGLPAGLTLSPEGMLSGKPTKSYLSVALVVTASAEGFASRNATFTFHIEDAMVSGVTVFEAEYTDLRGIVGSGYSGSATGPGLIQNVSTVPASGSKDGKTSTVANGGSYIPFVYGPITLTFEIYSDKAVSGASMSLGLDSEIGSIAIGPDIINVSVNGDPTSYSGTINKDVNAFTSFEKYACGTGDLVEGWNTITVSIVENTIYNGRTGGPAIDCLEIGNLGGATLSWRPALYNLPGLTQA